MALKSNVTNSHIFYSPVIPLYWIYVTGNILSLEKNQYLAENL